MGLLPKQYMKSDSYTALVDIWALGSIVHELLTARIPFLDIDSQTFISGIETNTIPMIDMSILFGYCHGHQRFPIEALESNGSTTAGIDFVKSLMAVDPGVRATAADALKNPWLVRAESLVIDSYELDPAGAPREVQLSHCSRCSDTEKPSASPPPTHIPPTASSVFNAQAMATLVGDRRQIFLAQANSLINKAIIIHVGYADCNKLIVQFCQSWGLLGAIPGHYSNGYGYWARAAENPIEPIRKLELWANAVEARGEDHHWERLVVRGLSDLMMSLLACD